MYHDRICIIKPPRCTNFSILFWNETLHVSESSSVHRQEYFTVHISVPITCIQREHRREMSLLILFSVYLNFGEHPVKCISFSSAKEHAVLQLGLNLNNVLAMPETGVFKRPHTKG
jgi:hypothetical protein